ncbi:hypothetical protein [Peribacillus butanolivorans]|uniref:hypothetical protein n=1 Tax=Peribacillus butanolivorans TaxID=421767 RepID=UPI0037FC3E8F
MKILLIAGLSVFLLSGCGDDKEKTAGVKEDEVKQTETTEPTQAEVDSKEEETKVEGPLTKVGQQVEDDGVGTVTLDKIVDINKDYETGGLKIKLLDAKVLTVTDVVPEFKENVESMSDVQVGDEFTYLQVRYDLENTTKETVIFNGLETAVPDNGKQVTISGMDIFATSNPTSSEIYSNASVEQNVFGIPIDKNLNSIRLIPSDVLYDNEDHSIFYPKEITIEF